MDKIVCSKCKDVFDAVKGDQCPQCGRTHPHTYEFKNSDEFLRAEVGRVMEERKALGLQGLTGGLECVIINTEPENQLEAARELLRYTGFMPGQVFEEEEYATCVLELSGSADILVRSRKGSKNPFAEYNLFPKSEHLPNTRFETFVFGISDLDRYFSIQRNRGVRFLTDKPVENDRYLFIQTAPSAYTGNSIGYIQWKGERGNYMTNGSKALGWDLEKPERGHLGNILRLDHTATRVRAEDRDAAIIEFMELTDYAFEFAIYVKIFNSITNVARLSSKDFAMVFTSGIAPYVDDEVSGPTEKFISNYGPRVHHMAFETEEIVDTYEALTGDGMEFLIELIGSEEEGLRQTFSAASPNTLLVNEYIQRYGNFDGFFTKGNVTQLTGATDKQ